MFKIFKNCFKNTATNKRRNNSISKCHIKPYYYCFKRPLHFNKLKCIILHDPF